MNIREEGEVRLYPSLFNSRYYYLNQLRRQIEHICGQFFFDKKKRILIDYGCGNMPYRPLIEPHVEQYIGVDLPDNPRAEITISPNGSINRPEASIDVVLSTQVLEHVEDPLHYLSEANRVLKMGGLLILSTHGYWMFHPDPTDFWRWTSAGLQKIIEQEGFEIVYFRGIISRMAMGVQLFQDGLIFKLPEVFRSFFSILLQPLIAFFDLFSSQEAKDKDACTYVLVARKKL